MRYREFRTILREYSREKTIAVYGNKILRKHNNDPKALEDVFYWLEKLDPTPNNQYTPWLALQYIRDQVDLRDPKISEVLYAFDRFKPRLQKRDINQYDYKSLESAVDKILNPSLDDNVEGGFPQAPNTHVLYNGPYGQLVTGLTRKASQRLGSGTEWCTGPDCDTWKDDSEPPRKFTKIIDSLIVWKDRTGKKYQIRFDPDDSYWEDAFSDESFVAPGVEIRDQNNDPLEREEWLKLRTHPVLSKFFDLAEKEMLQNRDPKALAAYAAGQMEKRWPEAEDIISADPESAYVYARWIIQGPWPKGEKAIFSEPWLKDLYQKHVLDQ